MMWIVKFNGEEIGKVLSSRSMTNEEICHLAGVSLAVTKEDFEGISENGKYDFSQLEIVGVSFSPTLAQKKDLIDMVVTATLSALSDNMEALDYLVDAACIRATAFTNCDLLTFTAALLQSVENIGKASSLIADEVKDFCLEFGCFDKEEK